MFSMVTNFFKPKTNIVFALEYKVGFNYTHLLNQTTHKLKDNFDPYFLFSPHGQICNLIKSSYEDFLKMYNGPHDYKLEWLHDYFALKIDCKITGFFAKYEGYPAGKNVNLHITTFDEYIEFAKAVDWKISDEIKSILEKTEIKDGILFFKTDDMKLAAEQAKREAEIKLAAERAKKESEDEVKITVSLNRI